MNTILVMASIAYCFVGCNVGSKDRQALQVLACDTETGKAKIVQSVKGCEGTTYFQIDNAGHYLYTAVAKGRDEQTPAAIVRFPLNGEKLGEMERVCDLPCEGPCHVSLTPDGTRVAFAAYLSATAGTVGIDGCDLRTFVFPDDAMGTNRKRQKKAYAHQTFHLPDGRLGVVDLGCDRIWFFDPKTMKRDESLSIAFDAGDGPRHALWSKDGKVLFVLCELGSCVCSFGFDGQSFRRLQRISMLPEGLDRWEADRETLATKAAAIKLTADGRILMASNRGYDSIAFYEVDPAGHLTLRNVAKLRGSFPRDFELMPGERFMVVGHKMSNEIQIYRFDREQCALEPVGDPIPVWRPLCFKFGGAR